VQEDDAYFWVLFFFEEGSVNFLVVLVGDEMDLLCDVGMEHDAFWIVEGLQRLYSQ
jgi:hypothetical protein